MVIQRGVQREEEKVEEKVEEKKEEKPTSLQEAKSINERKAELLEREEKLQKRKEDFEAERMVGGQATAGGEPEKPKELTDKEYADKLDRGEVNPMKEDGFDS